MTESFPELPINGVLDLHTFKPKEVKDLIQEYCLACRDKGIYQIRIIHGKGLSVLKTRVHSILSKMPEVKSFRLASETEGGWGATIVILNPL